jgi:hypothetical protein
VLLWIRTNRAELEGCRLDLLPELGELIAAAAPETEHSAPDVSLRLVPPPGACGVPSGGTDAPVPKDPSIQSCLESGSKSLAIYLQNSLARIRSHAAESEKDRDHAARERGK